MEKDVLLDFFTQTQFATRRAAQKEFLALHMKNALLIGKNISSLMGASYKLSDDEFERLIGLISSFSNAGDEIAFDLIDADKYPAIRKVLSKNGYLIYEHMQKADIENYLLKSYNKKYGAVLHIIEDYHLILAVKKEHLKS